MAQVVVDELTTKMVDNVGRSRMVAMSRCDAAIAMPRRRVARMSTHNVAMTVAKRPCNPRGVPTPIN